jgi:hypothetical protein
MNLNLEPLMQRKVPVDRTKLDAEAVRTVANRQLRARIIAGLTLLGEIEGSDVAAVIGYGWPGAVRRGRFVRVMRPSPSQWSAARRALAGLKAAGIVVGVGRRRRCMIYRLRADEVRFAALTTGPLE